MDFSRRAFLKTSSLSLAIPTIHHNYTPSFLEEPTLISLEERQARIQKAQKLLKKNKIRALILDAGITMEYFLGIRWSPSERTMLAIIPDKGEVAYICPGFEEDRFREVLKIGQRVLTWDEHENPFKWTIDLLKELGISEGKIAIEEKTRFFIFNGLRKSGKSFQWISADPITIPCRLIKSKNEIALMQRANDITVQALKVGLTFLSSGISPKIISQKIAQTHTELGAIHQFASVTFGVATSFPHGSSRKQILQKGDVVMMDCGCSVGGYESDITRTVVFGEPSTKQIEIWKLEQKSQLAGFAAAQLGSACEQVDIAARGVLTQSGFGPGYRLPGLPHRTGHGIGMEGHEWGNMVKGNTLQIQVGMCFSIEPTIAIPNEFGIRLEDCVYMTENGPQWFSKPSPSIYEPF